MRCLGLDLGSTTIKGALLDLGKGTLSHFHSEPFPGPESTQISLSHEVCLEKVMAATQAVLVRLIQEAPDANELFVCSQMGGLVLSDSRRKPLTRYISWRDQRTLTCFSPNLSFLEEAGQRIGPDGLAKLGNELKAGTATALLFWLAQNGQLPSGAIACSLGEWVVSHMTQAPLTMHPTMAIGWLDLPKRDWGHESFDKLGLGQVTFPHLHWDIASVGTYRLGHRAIQVHPALGDQQCALFGTHLRPGELSINASTGSQVSRLARTFTPGPYQSRFYFDNLILDTITHIPAGRSLNAIIDLLTEIPRANGLSVNAWDYIAKELGSVSATKTPTPTGLDCGLSFFPGPLGSTGHLTGITLENLTVRNLMIAALDSMAAGYKVCAERLGSVLDWNGMVLSGGLAHSLPTLRDRICAAFGAIPLRETPGSEETLMGLLHLAQKQFGFLPANENTHPSGAIA